MEHDFGDGDLAVLVELPLPPFEMIAIAAEDASDASRSMLLELIQGWDELSPKIVDQLRDGIESYDCEQELGNDEFMGSICHMDPESFMGDKSDYLLRIEFPEPPLWDFFLKDNQIIHFQPVF